MDVGAELEQIRESFSAASVVAFADLSANMILRSSSRSKMKQEELDALCTEARSAFASPLLALSEKDPEEFEDCVIVENSSVLVLLRSNVEPGDALICRCDREIDLAKLLSEGRSALEKISVG